MILCLDAGNTRLKWGVHNGQEWQGKGACAHEACEGLASTLPRGIGRILACNVAGSEVAQRIESLAVRLDARLGWFRSEMACCGVSNAYDNPAQLGPDRWAALVGARALHAGHALVVTAGTATTIDVLTASGRFSGGLILPGIELMRRSLACNTAVLPEARGSYRDMPTNTDDAITSGILHATLGAVERMACRLASADFLCLLSGGGADLLQAHIDLPLIRVEHLVLEGLVRAAGRGDYDYFA